jgi:hypothetical protein
MIAFAILAADVTAMALVPLGKCKMATPKVFELPCANGALLAAPVWEQHYRGSNWLALIDIDATSPGGLSRKFLNRGKGECLYVIEQVGLFDAVEFGADYTTSVGRRKPARWYGVVIAKTDSFLHVEQAETGAEAVLRAKAARVSPTDRAAAVAAERRELEERIKKLDDEIISLAEPKE